jgi:hypothetical protein
MHALHASSRQHMVGAATAAMVLTCMSAGSRMISHWQGQAVHALVAHAVH